MSADELYASIEVYQNQLKEIEGAVALASGEEEKRQLLELQENLLQLLDLTLQQLSQHSSNEQAQDPQSSVKKEENEESSQSQSEGIDAKNIDDEFALFQSEIAELTGGSEEEKTESKYSEKELEALEGTKCRSPFVEKWGGLSYHNAVILSIVREEGKMDLENPKAKVLFTQPTSLEMLTCRFFLSGRCKYSEESCRFSHGKVVDVADIKDYREPEYDTIMSGSRVLVQHSEDLWTPATVQDILEDRSAFCVKYDSNKKVAEVQAEQMIPLVCDDNREESDDILSDKESDHEGSLDASHSHKLHNEDDSEEEEEETVFVPTSQWLQHSLTQRLGDWEKYTTGIGSKLMQKMGYIVGTGLGPLGEGRVEPVVAYVYPQGVSLDRCMELREASNGEELLQVEKRLDREKRKEEAKSAQAAERLRRNTSVFDIINKKLGGKEIRHLFCLSGTNSEAN